jgi:hypothetical protein
MQICQILNLKGGKGEELALKFQFLPKFELPMAVLMKEKKNYLLLLRLETSEYSLLKFSLSKIKSFSNKSY